MSKKRLSFIAFIVVAVLAAVLFFVFSGGDKEADADSAAMNQRTARQISDIEQIDLDALIASMDADAAAALEAMNAEQREQTLKKEVAKAIVAKNNSTTSNTASTTKSSSSQQKTSSANGNTSNAQNNTSSSVSSLPSVSSSSTSSITSSSSQTSSSSTSSSSSSNNSSSSSNTSSSSSSSTSSSSSSSTSSSSNTSSSESSSSSSESSSSSTSSSESSSSSSESSSSSSSSSTALEPIEFNITGSNFSFSETTLRVKEGQVVTINFESTDGFHDWVSDDFNARTEQVNPGTPTSVTFVADKNGSYEYYCSVGNHRASGMVGVITVE